MVFFLFLAFNLKTVIMKKLLLSISLVLALGSAQAQVQYAFGFEGTTAALTTTAGWQVTNQSSPIYTGAPTWSIPAAAPTTTFAGGAQAGTATSFALINYTSTGTSSSTGSGTISNWLISPVVTVQNGDVVSFYTRIGRDGGAAVYADNLELRMSTAGAFSTNPTGGDAFNVGDFTNLLVEVNPGLDLVSYPTAWGQFSYTITGLAAPTDVKFAFRYFVTDGGPAGANSDIIGIDTFNVNRPLSTESFFASNFSVYPNPADSVLNISNKNNTLLNQVQLTDINGRIVKNVNADGVSNTQINIGDLNAGVYFLRITSDNGVGTAKIIKG